MGEVLERKVRGHDQTMDDDPGFEHWSGRVETPGTPRVEDRGSQKYRRDLSVSEEGLGPRQRIIDTGTLQQVSVNRYFNPSALWMDQNFCFTLLRRI